MRLIEKLLLPLIGKSRLRSLLTRRFERDLQAFLKSGQQIRFKPVNKPDVSVIIPVFNSAHHTLRCLLSLVAERNVSLEVIVFDNASNDATAELLQRCENLVVINSPENLGFVGAINAAAKHAHGRFLLMLNNDATILSGSIRDATEVFNTETNVGAVGARIRLATGHIQEAGSIIFQDGTTDGYLRNKRTEDPTAMYMRDVDFCSGVFLAVERRQFAALGGLDEIFAPGYYEETDLCMRLRAQGLRIIYNPAILIEHFEFGSLPSATAFKTMAEHRLIFLKRWQVILNSEGYRKRGSAAENASRRLIPRPRLLLILDNCPPRELPNSIQQAIHSAVGEKWQVSLFIIGLRHVSWAQFYATYGTKIELVLNRRGAELSKLLRKRKNYFDVIAAIGVRPSAELGKFRKVAPGCLMGVECLSSVDVTELEQMLEKLSIQAPVQD